MDERERLQRIAYGPDSSPEDAAAAALALGLFGRPRQPEPLGDAGAAVPAPAAAPGARPAPRTDPVPAPPAQAAASTAPPVGHTGSRKRPTPLVRSLLLHPVALVAATAVIAFLLGGLATNLLRAHGTTDADGPSSSVAEQTSLARILPRSQTAADRLPSALRTDMHPSTSRLLFANGSDAPSTPWEAWVVRRTDGELCFIASPDRRATTSSCVPASVAFGSSVSLVARDGSDVLTVHVDRGGVEVVLVGPGPSR
jgi:hypothetical protein